MDADKDTAEDAPSELVAAPVRQPCGACTSSAVVQWRRRPTAQEIAEAVAVEEARREQLLASADPRLPLPVFGPLPTGEDMIRTVYACAAHGITLDAAARIHMDTCTAPNPALAPGCDCTPEVPVPDPPAAPPVQLPAHWITG